MTEAEWRTGSDPEAVREYVQGRVTDREARLLACSLSETYRSDLGDDRSAAVGTAYRVADGAAAAGEREAAFAEAYSAGNWAYNTGPVGLVAAYTRGDREQVSRVP